MIRIIAIGSPFGDDNISFRVMDEIKPNLLHKYPSIDICYLDRPGMQLINEIQGTTCAVLIDAVLTDTAPGQVLQLEESQLDSKNNTLSSHDLSVAEAIKLARQLDVLPEQLAIVGIGIQLGQTLSNDQLQTCSKQLFTLLEHVMCRAHC